MKRRLALSAKPPAITLLVEEPRWRQDASVVRAIRRAVRLAVKSSSGALSAGSEGKSVAILLTNDAKLRALNAGFRGKDKPTNVLSFAASAKDPGSLGDIAMAYGMVAREARAQKKNFADHAAHLAMHGTLHLQGLDHEKANDARRMEELEIQLLARIGIADPYRPRPYTKGRKAA